MSDRRVAKMRQKKKAAADKRAVQSIQNFFTVTYNQGALDVDPQKSVEAQARIVRAGL